jgi:protein-disulfide isomerase
MKAKVRFGMAALALVTAAACDKKDEGTTPTAGGSSAPAIAAPDGQAWTDQVVATPEGGFLMGNPNAPVKLVEYASLTCPHCKDFTAAASDPLREKYVKTGQVSWEFRNFVLNPLDVAATLLSRCQGPAPFFKLTEQAFADQDAWVQKLNAAGEPELQRISGLPEDQQFVALAKAAGLDQFFRTRGLPEAKINACLTDKAALQRIVALRDLGTNSDKVTGTPAFLINGTLQEGVYDWTGLEAKLREAVG